MGEYATDTFSLADNALCWIIFLIATVVLQLIFMNMLIAIMGETFGRVSESMEQSALHEKVNMINDNIFVLS